MSQASTLTVFDGRKEERLNSGIADQISSRTYNAVMCATLLWGFLVNALMVAYLAKPISQALAGVSPWVFFLGYFVLAIDSTC